MTVLDARLTGQAEGGASFSLGHRLFRLVWIMTWLLLASWTPPPLHGWRRMLLRMFGARIARGARIYGGATIWYPPMLVMEEFATFGPGSTCYNQAPIHVGARAIISQGAFLCAGTHDISDPNFQLVTRPIHIGSRAWIAADAFVGPGVTIGEGSVLGARAVAMRDIGAWEIWSGNPAAFIKKRVLRNA